MTVPSYHEGQYGPHLADLVWAISKLKPADEEACQAILSALGLATRDLRLPVQHFGTGLARTPETQQTRDNLTQDFVPLPSAKPVSDQNVEKKDLSVESSLPLPSTIVPLSHNRAPVPRWVASTPKLPYPKTSHALPLLHEPLLKPEWVAGLLLWSVGIQTPESKPDIETIVKTIASGQVIASFPSRSRPTLVRGIHLVVDESDGMEPFIQDQRMMIDTLFRILGPERIHCSYVVGSPLSAAVTIGALSPGTPVVGLTDLGLTSQRASLGSNPDDWLEFQGRLEQSGCPLTVFVPFPPRRWPRRLIGRLHMIHWDRTVTLSGAKR